MSPFAFVSAGIAIVRTVNSPRGSELPVIAPLPCRWASEAF
jgi:hypothetical protein